MLKDIDYDRQVLRWDNAISIIIHLRLYCFSNYKGFILDDGIIYKSSDLNIDYSSGIISLYNKNTCINLYVNDVEKDEGVYDTTEEWLKRTGLIDVKFVNLRTSRSFYEGAVQGDIVNF